jgi:hypothetical protein
MHLYLDLSLTVLMNFDNRVFILFHVIILKMLKNFCRLSGVRQFCKADKLASSTTTTYREKVTGDVNVYDHLCMRMCAISQLKLKLREATQAKFGSEAIMLSAPD